MSLSRARPLAVPLAAAEACDAARFGPKAANLAALARAGLPTPGGFCVDAEAYRLQLAHLGLEERARRASSAERPLARRLALEVRLGLLDRPVAPALLEPLLAAWRSLPAAPAALGAVRSSALVEDRAGATFAGQFESYLGLAGEDDFLTAVRACWAALWSSRALSYMATHEVDPAGTAMALLVQPLVAARVSGGGLSRTAGGDMLLTATPGFGSAIAQGEVVPDRYVLGRDGALRAADAGRDDHRPGCVHHAAPAAAGAPSPGEPARAPCLDAAEISRLGRMLRAAEDVLGVPVEIEWALGPEGPRLLQARPLEVEAAPPSVPDEVWLRHPGLTGQGGGMGWSSGRACVVSCECELARVGPGDVLVTRVGGPALAGVLPRVAAVVAELGGSTSHLASLGRERRIPMVLGVLDATRKIPEGARVAVDGVAGIVRWAR
jgi:pyruvate, water dikinase